MADIPWSEYVRSELLRQLKENGETIPEPVPEGGCGRHRAAIQLWFEQQDARRIKEAEQKKQSDEAFAARMREKRAVISAEKREQRRVRQNEAKRLKRREQALLEGRAVRGRTDLSGMTSEQKDEHRRKKERLKKQVQRRGAASSRMTLDPNFGRF